MEGSDAMFKVWTDGLDVVVAQDVTDVPDVLDRHYRVTGHTLRHRRWEEVAPATTLRLRGPFGVGAVSAAAILAVGGNRWVGRTL